MKLKGGTFEVLKEKNSVQKVRTLHGNAIVYRCEKKTCKRQVMCGFKRIYSIDLLHE